MDGSIPNLTFEQQNSFLFIQQGTKIPGVSAGGRWLKIKGVRYLGVARNPAGDKLTIMNYRGINAGRVSEGITFVTDGENVVLGQDVWIPFFPADETTSLQIEVVNAIEGGETEYTSPTWNNTPAVGKVYDISGKF